MPRRFFRRDTAAHGRPPYAGCGADLPENGNPSGAFRWVVEDADPYETGLAEFAKQIKFKSIFQRHVR